MIFRIRSIFFVLLIMLTAVSCKKVKVDSEVLYRAMRKGEKMANGRYGTVVAVG